MARSMRDRSRERSSGRSRAVSEVLTALIPQPMSTPTAAGQTAPRMAMTEPTVAPFPRWTSGITARPVIQGRVEMLRSCCIAALSTVAGSAHMGMGTLTPGTSVYDMAVRPPRSDGKKTGWCRTFLRYGAERASGARIRARSGEASPRGGADATASWQLLHPHGDLLLSTGAGPCPD